MAVYRKRRRIHPALIIGFVILIIGGLILAAVLIRLQPGPASADPLAGARAKALEAAQGLEVFTIEYPQAAQGAELSGAVGALNRAQAAFESARGDLSRIDAAAVDKVTDDFAEVKEKVNAHAPAEEVLPLAEDARETLLALAKP